MAGVGGSGGGGARPRPRPRPGRRPRVAALAAATLAVVAPACGDGGAGAADADQIGIDARPGAGGATGAAALDGGDARRAVEGLLAAHDRIVNRIVADPSVAADASDPLVRQYVALFEPGSPHAAGALRAWADQAADGLTTRPFSADHPAFTSRLDGEVEVVADGEVRFPTCDEQRYGVADEAGDPIRLQPHAEVPGEGTAVVVDGEWRLRRLDVFAGADGCRRGDEGGA
jgi:hypothetical protein